MQQRLRCLLRIRRRQKTLKDNPAAARELIHGYFASVSYIDAQVGKLLDAPDNLELTDNTIVILWGDHGFYLGDLGYWGKHTLHEHPLRSAFMMRVPGMTSPGAATQSITGSIDIFPTLAELAGLPVPDHLDGKSFASIIQNPAANPVGSAIGFWRGAHTLRSDCYRLIDLPDQPQLLYHIRRFENNR